MLPKKDQRVCSHHFVQGEPTTGNPNPTLHLKRTTDHSSPPTKRHKQETQPTEANYNSTNNDQYLPNVPPPQSKSTINKSIYLTIVCLISILLSLWRKACTERDNLKKDNDRLLNENDKLRNRVLFHTNQFKSKYLQTDDDVRFFTGIPSALAFQRIHDLVEPCTKRRWKGSKSKPKGRKFITPPRSFGPIRKLTSEMEMILTLMRLRLGLTYKDLAKRFTISVSLATQVFNCWLTALYQTFGRTVKWFPKDHIRATLPGRFRSLPNLRSIIDCSEIFIETPKDMTLQAMTWSNYKHHNTLKFLISVAPNSTITYVSPTYGGRLSDKHIVMITQFLDLFDPHDMIMADKGFPIQEDCSFRSLQLLVPPGKRGQDQMSISDIEKTKKIATLRILVEQVIRRLKTFRILKYQLPICQLHAVDKMITVCAALCNTHQPIYRT